MKKYILRLFFFFIAVALISAPLDSIAQAANPAVMAQVRAILGSKGLNEEEVKTRLKSKGIDVEKMSQDDLVKNKAVIEQTVNEMEAEKKAAVPASTTPASPASSNTATPAAVASTETVVVDNVAIEISKKETAAELLQEAVVDPLTASSIYGHKMFREKSLEIYRVSKDASPPDNYILAAGDKINILIFGRSQADLSFEVNSGGFIQPSQMPKIFLSGLTLKQAKEMLVSRFSTFYSFEPGQFSLTLNTSRTLTVNVFGEVEKAGSYTTSALNTALGALAVSGGPTEIGSVRNIQIIRGATRKTLDVYSFMRDPAIQFDFYLQNNDIIYVPTAEKIVSLEGAVKRPMNYELKTGEGLKELLEYAGGLKADAYTDFLQVQRIENNKVVLNDYKLNEILKGTSTLEFKNGDIVRIKSINSPLKSFVKITGAVEYSGSYDLKSTPTIKMLFDKARVKPEAKKEQAFLIRKKLDQTAEVIAVPLDDVLSGKSKDINLQQEDEVIVYEQSRYVDQFGISVVGEVRNPFERAFRYDQSLSVEEAIQLAGGLKPAAAEMGYIYRTDPFKATKTQYIPIDFKQSFKEQLKPGDKLVILNKDTYEREFSITITGDVKKPTVLRYDSSLTVKDLIKISSGFNLSSDPQYVEVFRLSFNKGQAPVRSLIKLNLNEALEVEGNEAFELAPYDIVVVRRIADFSLQETIEVKGEVFKQGPYALRSKRYHFSDLINDAGGFTQFADVYNTTMIRYADKSGVVVFNAEDAMKNKRDLSKDPILVKGDYIVVPELDNTVFIEAAGTNYLLAKGQRNLQITYQGQASASRYIKKYAGGFDEKADKNTVRVVRQNGMVESTRPGFIFKKYPRVMAGDRIVVSFNNEEEKKKREVKPLDWDKLVSRILAVATTLALIQAYVK